MMKMIKLTTFFALATGAAALNQSEGRGALRGLKSTDGNIMNDGSEVAESLKASNSLGMSNDKMDIDEFNNRKEAIDVFAPSDLQADMMEKENDERNLSSWCYDFYPGAMRTSNHHNAKGTQGTDYHLYEHKSESWCKSSCSSNSWCKAYEYYHSESRCELWKKWYGFYSRDSGFKSYVKKHC
jgi:hypothetical protein